MHVRVFGIPFFAAGVFCFLGAHRRCPDEQLGDLHGIRVDPS